MDALLSTTVPLLAFVPLTEVLVATGNSTRGTCRLFIAAKAGVERMLDMIPTARVSVDLSGAEDDDEDEAEDDDDSEEVKIFRANFLEFSLNSFGA